MPLYFFVLEGPDGMDDDESGTECRSDYVARQYAERIVSELKAAGYDDPRQKVIVKNTAGEVVHVVPF